MKKFMNSAMWAATGMGAGYLASKYGKDMMKKVRKTSNKVKQNVKNSSAS